MLSFLILLFRLGCADSWKVGALCLGCSASRWTTSVSLLSPKHAIFCTQHVNGENNVRLVWIRFSSWLIFMRITLNLGRHDDVGDRRSILKCIAMFMSTSSTVEASYSGPLRNSKDAWKYGGSDTQETCDGSRIIVLNVKQILHWALKFQPYKMMML